MTSTFKQYYVYITTNLITGKQYVGDHKINPTRGEYYIGSGLVFRKAIKKYGVNSFFKEILEWFDTREEAFLSQAKYIQKFNTLQPNGYNVSPTGGVGVSGSFTEETKQKIGNASRGRKQSPETIAKRVATILERNKIRPKRKASAETRKKLSEAHKGPRPWRRGIKRKPLTEEQKNKLKLRHFRHRRESKIKIGMAFSKPILQYTLEGVFIKEYSSAIEASKILGTSQRNICSAASPKSRQKTAIGYIWKYKLKNND